MIALIVPLALLARSAAAGPTYVVNSLADVPAGPNVTDGVCETATGNGVCTLRAAIMEANAGVDAIVRLPAGFYPLTAGTLNVLAPMTIEGDGPSISVVDGINLARVFRIVHAPVDPPVAIRGLTIQRGFSNSPAVGGGGILVDSPLLLENVHLKNNVDFLAAGLRVNASLVMRHCVVEGNQVSSVIGNGGGIHVSSTGSLTIEDSRIERNTASEAGAGIFAAPGSNVRLERTLVARNLDGGSSSSTTKTGGGLEVQGTAVVLNSLFWGNASPGAGGGIHVGGGSTQLFHVTVTNNSGFAPFAANPPGGALAVAGGAALSLTRSIVTSNKSECLGSIFSGDYNVVRSAADCPLFGLLGHNVAATGWTTLAFNGGFSPDVSSAGTLAEGAVPASSCLDDLGAPLATDIRGHRRKPPACDPGAHDALATFTPAQLLGVNLVRNGGAQGEELGLAELVANPTNVDLYQAPYWAQSGRMVQIQYGAPDGYPTLAEAPPGSGHKFFAGGIDPVTIGRQIIDVSSLAAEIDAGGVSYDVSGAFGGYLTDDDRASLVVQFQGDLGIVEVLTLGGFTAADRGNQTGLIADGRFGVVPAATRFIDVSLTFERAAGNANDGYADDVSLVLPEPGLASSLGAALLLIAGLGRKPGPLSASRSCSVAERSARASAAGSRNRPGSRSPRRPFPRGSSRG